MKRKVLVAVLAALLVAVVGASAIRAAEGNKRVVIGDQLQVNSTGNGASGVFTAAGAINDSGTSSLSFHVVSVKDDVVNVEGRETLTGMRGSITMRFKVRSVPASEPREFFTGVYTIIAGTGRYDGLRGERLTSKGVVDFTTARITDILDSRG